MTDMRYKGFTCPRCNEPMHRMMQVTMDMVINNEPPTYAMTKKNLRRKGIRIVAADWDKSFIWCPACGWNQNTSVEKTKKEADS
jgi:transcription elongation factor Elf1